MFNTLSSYVQKKVSEANQAKQTIEHQNELMSEMRIKYSKELESLRAMVQKKNHHRGDFEYIDIRYFDVSIGLPEQVIEALNTKLRELKNAYNTMISECHQHYAALNKQVRYFEEADYPEILKL